MLLFKTTLSVGPGSIGAIAGMSNNSSSQGFGFRPSLNSENVLPATPALGGFDSLGTLKQLKTVFESSKDKLDELDDPLSLYDSYHLQLQSLLTTADPLNSKLISADLIPLLDEATRMFAHDPRYRNDPRYLKLWLAYAKYCRDAEEIFQFLSQQGIAQDLATFYEEYALLLERKAEGRNRDLLHKAVMSFRRGIERKAQPLERLKKKFSDFQSRVGSFLDFPPMSAGKPTALKPIEVRGYDSDMIHNSDFSFEEIRAMHWYAKPKIAKPVLKERSIVPSAITQIGSPMRLSENIFNVDDDEDEGSLPALGVSVNPDDLTHINVFKDNTADLREIAKLVKSGNQQSDAASAALGQAHPNKAPPSSDWLLKEIIKTSPRKSPLRQMTVSPTPVTSSKRSFIDITSSPIREPPATKAANTSSNPASTSAATATSNENQPQPNNYRPADYKVADVVVVPDLLDPFDLEFRVAQAEAVLSQIAPAIPNFHLRLSEPALAKVRSFEKSLGRDGSGPNHTVSSLRIASGHFFMERKLGEGGYGKVYLGVDLQKEEAEAEAAVEEIDQVDSNQVAIKIETPASVWEAYILFRLAAFIGPTQPHLSRHFPRLLSGCVYQDVSFVVMDYYEQGSLLAALNCYRQQNLQMEEAVVLFYAAELLKIVGILHRAAILHTDVKLENILLYSASSHNHSASSKKSGGVTWSSCFRRDGSEGWNERGLVLIDFGRAVDLKLLREEDASRFLIKPKHANYNGCPRIAQGLPVGHEMDWFGVADCLHWMLFQRPLTAEEAARPFHFKRYWQVDLWEPLFADLIAPPSTLTGALDCMKRHLEAIWDRLESWKRTPSLKSLLTRQEIMLYDRKL